MVRCVLTITAFFAVIGCVAETLVTHDPVLGLEWGGVIGFILAIATHNSTVQQ